MKHQLLPHHLLQCLCKYLLFMCRLERCLYPCNTILHFLCILTTHNRTKTHTLLLLFVSNIDRLKNTVLFVNISGFFSISMTKTFSEKKNLLYDSLVLIPNSYVLRRLFRLDISTFFYIFHIFFEKLHCSSTWKKPFWNPFSHFCLALCLYQCIILAKPFNWI